MAPSAKKVPDPSYSLQVNPTLSLYVLAAFTE